MCCTVNYIGITLVWYKKWETYGGAALGKVLSAYS